MERITKKDAKPVTIAKRLQSEICLNTRMLFVPKMQNSSRI